MKPCPTVLRAELLSESQPPAVLREQAVPDKPLTILLQLKVGSRRFDNGHLLGLSVHEAHFLSSTKTPQKLATGSVKKVIRPLRPLV